MGKCVSTKVHGAIDYASAIVLLAGPRALGWEPKLASALDALAGATVAYSLLTDYEFGALRVVPMPAHLAVDAVNAATTSALPWLLGVRDRRIAACLAAVAAFEAAVLLSTRTAPEAARGEVSALPRS